jgi:tungstate transport system permease protein
VHYLLNSFSSALQLIINVDYEIYYIIYTTLYVTFFSLIYALFFGLITAFFLSGRRDPISRMLKIVFNTLLSLPTVTVGLFVYIFLMQKGPFGPMHLLFTKKAIIVGQTILAYPIITSLVVAMLENYDKRLKEFLLTLGVKKLMLMKTTLWEARLGIMISAITAYGRIISEVGTSMILGGNIKGYTRTLTTAISLETSKGSFEIALALGLILLIIAFIINITLHFLKKLWEM